jgi:N-acetylglucosaminyldiphosphoundecaprenol N-acetyl-beta-D-mannosaminyltransferase
MPVVAASLALAAVVWGSIYARRGSLLLGSVLIVFVSYVLGHEFWNANVGPLPLTLDRMLLVGLGAAFAIRWRFDQLAMRPFTASDWSLAALLLLFATSALFSGQPEITGGVTSKWGRLIASFIIPAVVFAAIRHAPLSRRETLLLLGGFVLFGTYLAATALCEKAGLWSLVFPRYIANPNLGIHFGRARGPDLNSVSLGMYLTACMACAWILLPLIERRWIQLAIIASLPLMAAGVFFTYTRSTWLGLAASGLVIAATQIPRRWRLPTVTLAGLCGVLLVATSWSNLLDLQREGSVGDSEHSVDQRKSFAYVSWQMFKDNPVFGVGFGRFFDRKLPYLSDRPENIELDSIRPLHHHNTYLSVLTETGFVGLATFVTLVAVWVNCACRLAHNANRPPLSRAFGVLMLALVANFLCSALFHDLTLLPSQQLMLFAFAALTVNLRQESPNGLPARRAWLDWHAIHDGWHAARLRKGRGRPIYDRPIAALANDELPLPHVNLFGMQINRITMRDAVAQVLSWCQEPRGQSCRYVVTPNVDHAVMFQHRADLRAAYASAALVLADGAPIVLASRLFDQPLPERVAGSDLVPQILESTPEPLTLFLLGAAPGVAESAATRIEAASRSVKVVGRYSPPLGFENDAAENARILAKIATAQPDLLILGLGAPKQELWVHQHRHDLQAKVVLCAGATIDFLAGNRVRSPVWMRRAGLEWLHRLASEPRRLAARYARDAWVFPQLVWREWRAAK